TMEEMLDQIAERFTITPAKADHDSTSKRFWVPGGYFGIIPNESAPFCSTCSRLRLTSNGKLIGCLSNPEETSIRHLLDEPNPEEKLKSLVLESVSYKQSSFTGSDLVMSKIGG
ncbi:MAG: radical SAM protein, partial [SAR324 cluster bacterium]|nr:radical SAM protein [SAR324 cluster bacterium]